ncbi:MAG: hypothetical protein AAFW84_25535 [Cyanobacteria bacterium J06635_15]
MTQSSFSYERYVEPRRTSEGFVLTAFNTTALVWTNFILAVIFFTFWCVLSLPFFGVGLLMFWFSPSLNSLLPLLFPLIGIIGIVWTVRRMKRIERLNVSAEAISPIYPLLLGESCTVQFRCQRQDSSTAHPGNIAAKWLCYEWVEYRMGLLTIR